MNINQASLFRDMVGFLSGGLCATVAAVLVFLAFFPLPEPKPTDHTREALAMLVFVVFFCGGFVGRRTFSASFWSDLLPSVLTSYGVIVFLCLTANLDLKETGAMVGFASAGIVTSITALSLLARRFPLDADTYEL